MLPTARDAARLRGGAPAGERAFGRQRFVPTTVVDGTAVPRGPLHSEKLPYVFAGEEWSFKAGDQVRVRIGPGADGVRIGPGADRNFQRGRVTGAASPSSSGEALWTVTLKNALGTFGATQMIPWECVPPED